ncbi:MAG: DUF481 domain-containing protein [Nitrospinae bacterium]|nr:DUF481 domain-containing protein [Nitrospinota bacterium]
MKRKNLALFLAFLLAVTLAVPCFAEDDEDDEDDYDEDQQHTLTEKLDHLWRVQQRKRVEAWKEQEKRREEERNKLRQLREKNKLKQPGKESKEGIYGFVGGSVTKVSTDSGGYGIAAYYIDGGLTYKDESLTNTTFIESAFGDLPGTGNADKMTFFNRTDRNPTPDVHIGTFPLIPFFDFTYYRNPQEAYVSRIYGGPGVGTYFINNSILKSRENIFVYLDQDLISPAYYFSPIFTRGLIGWQADADLAISKKFNFTGSITAFYGADNYVDYNVNVLAALNWAFYDPFKIQFLYDHKYHNLVPLGIAPYTDGFIIQLLYTF